MNNRIIPASPLNNKNAEKTAKILQDRLMKVLQEEENDLTSARVLQAATEYNVFTSLYID